MGMQEFEINNNALVLLMKMQKSEICVLTIVN